MRKITISHLFTGYPSSINHPTGKDLLQNHFPVMEGLHKYCEVLYSQSGINQMWILKNSKELLQKLEAQSLSSVYSIKSYDLSTLYSTIPVEVKAEKK